MVHKCQRLSIFGGERGIRTLERSCPRYTLSKRAPSTTRTPLRMADYYILKITTKIPGKHLAAA